MSQIESQYFCLLLGHFEYIFYLMGIIFLVVQRNYLIPVFLTVGIDLIK